jgi:hypothetical protein
MSDRLLTSGGGQLLLRLSTRRDAEAMLPLATQLGKALGMRLSALFVEEEDAIIAATLPLPNVMDFSGKRLAATLPALETVIRLEAERCERLVQQSAEQAQLTWSFESRRGGLSSLLLGACRHGDMAVMRFDRLAGGWRDALGFARMLAATSGDALILRDAPRATMNTVLVIESGERCRRMADRIANALSAKPVSLSVSEFIAGAVPLSSQIGLVVIDNALLSSAEDEISQAITRVHASLLVLGNAA